MITNPTSRPDWLPYPLIPVAQRFYAQLAGIELVVLDVDGVLTDGTLYYTPQGDTMKAFNVKDGQGLTLLPRVNVRTGILTARQSPMVAHRANDLGMAFCCQGAKPKWPVLQSQLNNLNLPATAVAYMGDDWPDVPVLKQVGFACCPADATPVAQQHCHWISPYPGGHGAVRSLCDLLLAIKGFTA
jgi:3-deoxy-D-manno-octulosonate 8-phosphate phosphatase (KDO 8-P phosphatase)